MDTEEQTRNATKRTDCGLESKREGGRESESEGGPERVTEGGQESGSEGRRQSGSEGRRESGSEGGAESSGSEVPLTAYEASRLVNIERNNKKLEELGLPSLVSEANLSVKAHAAGVDVGHVFSIPKPKFVSVDPFLSSEMGSFSLREYVPYVMSVHAISLKCLRSPGT